MDAAAAEALLRSMTAASDDPALSDAEVAALLAASRIADATGLAPSDTAWTATYNLNIGARDGWKLKMGKVAGRFDFGSDVNRFSRSQFFAHCEKMVKAYSRAVAGSATLASSGMDAAFDPVIPVIGNING
jgi:hypothetical protein